MVPPADAPDLATARDAVTAAQWSSAAGIQPATLEVAEPLATLLGEPGLRRGALYVVIGSRSVMLALVARASRRSWCAIVGVEGMGLAAAQESGVCLDHLVLIPSPGHRWLEVVSTLVDSFDVVVLHHDAAATPAVARRLQARARQRGTVLILLCDDDRASRIEQVHLRLEVIAERWEGIGDGHGHLRARRVEVRAAGRGSGARGRQAALWLPSPTEPIATADPEIVERDAG